MKKALKIVLTAVVIMVTALCTAYAEQDTDAHTALLESLGIIDSEARYQDGVTTRAEFVTYVLRIANTGILSDAKEPEFTDVAKSHWAYNEISTAYALGLIRERGFGKFDPDSPVEAADAARMLLCAVGYTDYVNNMSDANVIRLAESVKLFENASKTVGMPLERKDIFEMLFNALSIDMPYLQSVKADGAPQYYIEKGRNILSERFGVYCTEGVVTADDNAAITGDTAHSGGVVIGGTVYDGALSDAEDYLGCNVVCYWADNGTSRGIVTIYPQKNTVLEMDFDDAEYTGSSFNQVIGGKRKNARINARTTVLINGCVVRDFEQINESLASYAGRIKMVDNDRDGVYDVVILKRYVNIRIASYDDIGMLLTGRNGEEIKLDGYEDIVVKDSYFDKSDISALAVDMVLSVYLPPEKDKRVVLVMGGAPFSGELLSKDAADEKHLKLVCDDDIAYDISKFCLFDFLELIVGENYTYYPDWSGDIAYAEIGVENLKIGYVKRVVLTEAEDGVQLCIFGSDGTNKVYTLKETVTLRGEDGTASRIADTDVYHKLAGVRQPVMYKLTNDGMISKLWLAASDESLIFHKLEDDVSKTNYRLEYRNNNFMGKYICTAQTCILTVPKNGDYEEDYKIGTTGMFTNGSYVYFENERTSVQMYAIEPDSFITDLMVYAVDYSASKGTAESTEPVVYLKNIQTVNEDNEIIYTITAIGYDGSEKKYEISGSDGVLCDMNARELHYGDVIRIAQDERGRITSGTIQTMYDCQADEHIVYLGSATVRYLAATRVIPAEVTARQGNYIRFDTYAGYEPDGSGYKASSEIAQIGSARVYVYDKAQNKIEQSTPARVAAGDKFVLYESYGVVRMIVYYK